MNYADGQSPVADYMASQDDRMGRVLNVRLTSEELDHIINRRRMKAILNMEYEKIRSHNDAEGGVPPEARISYVDDYDYSAADVAPRIPTTRAGRLNPKQTLFLISYSIIAIYLAVVCIGWHPNPLEW